MGVCILIRALSTHYKTGEIVAIKAMDKSRVTQKVFRKGGLVERVLGSGGIASRNCDSQIACSSVRGSDLFSACVCCLSALCWSALTNSCRCTCDTSSRASVTFTL